MRNTARIGAWTFAKTPLLLFLLSGCGGGGNDDSSGNPQSPANSAPTISGVPPTSVVQDTVYSFIPSASDPDNDPITFTIINQPGWSVFSSDTGALSGLPTGADLGLYTDILINASDGQESRSMAAFDIEVVPFATGSRTLSWTPPTENEDGSQLDDLAGYRIRWGTQSGDHRNLMEVNNPGISTFMVENLPPGTYFFVVSAFDASNNEGQASNEARAIVE